MKYYRTYWKQKHSEFPIWIFSEINKDRFDTRRLEVFEDGSAKYFDKLTPFDVGVSQYPENVDEVNNDELYLKEITLEDFEEALSHYDLDTIRGGRWE